MSQQRPEESLKTLQDIRSIMERSARFISLSGWSGIWAGSVALVGSIIARGWLKQLPAAYYNPYHTTPAAIPDDEYNAVVLRFVLLAVTVLVVALAGGIYFTWRKAKRQDGTIWNSASRRMAGHIAIPLAVGGIFALHFLYARHESYVSPICLVFYGLALINGSKYTLSDIKYLGAVRSGIGVHQSFHAGFRPDFLGGWFRCFAYCLRYRDVEQV